MREAIAFAAGVLLGSAATYFCVRGHFAKKSQEEIESVIKAFNGNKNADEESEPEPPATPPVTETSSIDEMRETYTVKLRDYRKSFEAKTKEEEMKERMESVPRVISPSEVNLDEYDQVEYTYYADKILADSEDKIVTDIFGMVGDALEHFGEYEEDTVLACNEKLKLIIEITRDARKYEDVVGDDPPDRGGD